MKSTEPPNCRLQLVWGVALVLVGIAVFFRIPQVMPQLAQMGQSGATLVFIRICFYIMGILLIGGGAKKIIYCLRQQTPPSNAEETDGDQ